MHEYERHLLLSAVAVLASNGMAILGLTGFWNAQRFAVRWSVRIAGSALVFGSIVLGLLDARVHWREYRIWESVERTVGHGEIDELSGATTVREGIVVVDDERGAYLLTQTDAGQVTQSQLSVSKPCDGGDEVYYDDLEAAAYDRVAGRLYLMGSHSNTQRGNNDPGRQQLLELEARGTEYCVARHKGGLRERFAAKLGSIAALPFVNTDGEDEVMNAEGLAIDGERRMLIGFRAPLSRSGHAIVLRAPVDDVMSDVDAELEFEVMQLLLARPGASPADRSYSITSLEFDPESNRVLILGNDEMSPVELTETLWIWDASESKPGAVVEPTHCSGDFAPSALTGKAEAIALLPSGAPTFWERLVGSAAPVFIGHDTEDTTRTTQKIPRRSLCGELSAVAADAAVKANESSGVTSP